MPLFAVERDLRQVSPEQFRSNLPGLVTACAWMQSVGKKVRYISTAVFPADARGLCLFGAEEPRWIHEVNEAARIPYSRIFAVLDLTPIGVRRDLSRGRWPTRVETVATPSRATPSNGGPPSRTSPRVSEDLTRWSDEARELMKVLGSWLEEAGRLQAEVWALEQENEALRAESEDLAAALRTIASQTARTVDELLSRLHGRRGAPGDLAER